MKNLKLILGALALTPVLATAELAPQTKGDVTYLCGGVGDAEQQQIKNSAGQYDMMLTFAARSGQYLADVDVQIKDRRGEVVLLTRCDGPLMLVNLPSAGRYQVAARYNGEIRRREMTAGSGRGTPRAVFTWPVTDAAFW